MLGESMQTLATRKPAALILTLPNATCVGLKTLNPISQIRNLGSYTQLSDPCERKKENL